MAAHTRVKFYTRVPGCCRQLCRHFDAICVVVLQIISFFFYKVINVLLIVHDSRTLLLGTSVGLGGQYNSDINDNIIVNDTLT